MHDTLASFKRIWNMVSFLSRSICHKVVWGTGRIAVGLGLAVSNIMAILIMACIVVLLGVVSISYGIFSKTQDPAHCEVCGQTDVELYVSPDGKTVCREHA